MCAIFGLVELDTGAVRWDLLDPRRLPGARRWARRDRDAAGPARLSGYAIAVWAAFYAAFVVYVVSSA